MSWIMGQDSKIFGRSAAIKEKFHENGQTYHYIHVDVYQTQQYHEVLRLLVLETRD